MPETGVLLVFAAASILLVAVPGPNLIYIVTRSVSQGRRAGVVSALGVETGTLGHVVAAALGVSAAVATSPLAFSVLKYGGAAYLLWLSLRTLTARTTPGRPDEVGAPPLGQVFRAGLVMNLLNPKVVLFFLAYLPQFVSPGVTTAEARTQMLVLGVVFLVLAFVLDLGYACAGAALGRRLVRRQGTSTVLRYVVAGSYASLAAYAAVM